MAVFLNSNTYSTGYDSFSVSIVTGDFNNDNYIDLAVANYGTDNVGILFGKSNGSFGNQMIVSTTSDSHPISIDQSVISMMTPFLISLSLILELTR